jgi:PHS family inorganic phosphate transporter-like MFS transporter
LTAIGYAGGSTVYHQLYHLAAGNAILICAGAIPGYWVSVATVDTIGRKPIQLMGFTMLTILFIIWGFTFKHLSGTHMFGIYVVVQFFFNFGKLIQFSSGVLRSSH